MPEPRDECREVELASGETIRVRGAGEMSPAAVAALSELVDATRALAAEHPADEGAQELWVRIDGARRTRGAMLRDVACETGVRFTVLFRIGQGYLPDLASRGVIDRWLDVQEPHPQ